EGPPVGAEGEVDLAVAVDVVGGDADVVGLGLVFDDDAPLPGRIFVPDDALLINDDNVLLAVAIHVHQQDRVANAEVFLDFLHFEARKDRFFLRLVRADKRWSEEKPEHCQHAANHGRSSWRVFGAYFVEWIQSSRPTLPRYRPNFHGSLMRYRR